MGYRTQGVKLVNWVMGTTTTTNEQRTQRLSLAIGTNKNNKCVSQEQGLGCNVISLKYFIGWGWLEQQNGLCINEQIPPQTNAKRNVMLSIIPGFVKTVGPIPVNNFNTIINT